MSLPFRWRKAAIVAIVAGWFVWTSALPEMRMFQTTFHIDKGNPKCLDVGGNGAEATPYCTMAYAATIANPGQTFLVHGPKHGDAPITFTRPGTLAQPITWRAVGYVALSRHVDVNDAAFTPSGLGPNVYQLPWTTAGGKAWQTYFPDIVVDDPNQTIFTLKDEDGPLVMTSVLTEAELIAHDGTYFRDAANQRMLVHPYGDVTPSNTATDFVVAVGNALTIDTKANYQIFDGFTITYTTGSSAQVLSSNNKLYNMHYVGQPLDIRGQTNYGENITINHGIWREGPLWEWFTDGAGSTGGFSFGTGHVMKNLHVFNSWNSTFNSEGTSGNMIDGGRFHSAPNHCTGAGNGNHIIRNAAWWNCQDYQWLFDPTGIVMEHVLIAGGGVAVSAIEGNTGPITIRNSMLNGSWHFVRGTGAAAGLPYDGCTWEQGSLMEYNIINAGFQIERCDTQISYPIDEYVARCASGEFTGCMTVRNNIKIKDWKDVLVDGFWNTAIGADWDFHHVPGSPAINAGMVSGALTDLIGISRPQPVGGLYDIGPYEFTPGGDPAPTGKPIVAAPAAVTTTITAPTSAATYDAGTSATLTTLAGTSKSGRTITGCTWTNSLGGSGSTSGTTSWTIASVALTVGSNVITVTCTNDGKTTGADIITVTRSSGGGGSACSGTCYYIRDGGTASITGTGACVSTGTGSWATGNACDSLPATLVRGATYYVAGGTYPKRNFSTAASGTQLITIKGATIAAHGGDTGWSNAFSVETNQAVWLYSAGFSDGHVIEIYSSYWVFDGSVGSMSSDPNAYGFRITIPSCPQTTSAMDVSNPAPALQTDITISHVAMVGCGPTGDQGQEMAFFGCAGCHSQNITFSHNYSTGIVRTANFSNVNNAIYEYNWVDAPWSSAANHGEIISASTHHVPVESTNITVRYSAFNACQGTACIACGLNGEANACEGMKIYGNVFKDSEAGNGVIATGSSASHYMKAALVYNNTFIGNDSQAFNVCGSTCGGSTGNVFTNNLFFDASCTINSNSGTVDSNYFKSCRTGAASGTNTQTPAGSVCPFTNCASDFHLLAATTAGATLSAPYNTDREGTIRGADGTWDRGALEFTGGTAPAPEALVAWLRRKVERWRSP